VNEAEDLIQLTSALEQRGAPIEQVLTAVQAAGTKNMILCVSSLTRRLELCVTLVPEAVALAAPDHVPATLPPRGMLRILVDGSHVTGAITSIGSVPAREAVDELDAPHAARDAWLAVVEPLLAVPGSYIMNRTRSLAEPRGMIGVAYPKRDADLERQFVATIEAHAKRINVTDAQLATWKKVYAVANTGEPLSVNTECTAAGPVARLSVLHGRSEWDRAVDVVKLIAPERATNAAAVLGLLAGTLAIDKPRGLDVIVGPGATADLVVWLMRS
jgi:hypothetical protein